MKFNGIDLDLLPQFVKKHKDPLVDQIFTELDQRCHFRVANEMAKGTMPIGKSGINLIVSYRDEAANAIMRERGNIIGFMKTIYGIMRALGVDKVEVSPANYLMMDNHIITRNDKEAETPGNMCFMIYERDKLPPGTNVMGEGDGTDKTVGG